MHYFRFAKGAILQMEVPEGRDPFAFANEVFGERPVFATPVA